LTKPALTGTPSLLLVLVTFAEQNTAIK